MSSRVSTPKSRSKAVRNVMRANKGVDTGPELKLRSLVHKAGLRYAIDVRPEHEINRRADMVFRSAKVAVFVNGCFWHGCPKHYVLPKTNRRFWSEKVNRNKERDKETRRLLGRRGWKVMTLWEHDDFSLPAEKIVGEVRFRRQPIARHKAAIRTIHYSPPS